MTLFPEIRRRMAMRDAYVAWSARWPWRWLPARLPARLRGRLFTRFGRPGDAILPGGIDPPPTTRSDG